MKPGWRWVRLEEVASHYSKTVPNPATSEYERFVSSDHIDRFDATVRSWGKSADIESSKRAFEAGDYLFVARSLYGSDFRERAPRVDFSGVCSNGILALRERPGTIAEGFLGAVLNDARIWDFVVRNATGTLTRYVYWKSLKDYEFALPPLDEQRRIARMLLATDSCAEAFRRLAKSHESLRRALIDELTDSERWPKVTVGDLCNMQNGQPFPGTAYAESGIRLLRPGNLDQSGYLTWKPSKTVFLSEQWEQKAVDFVIGPGDVVMNLTAQSLEDGFMGRVCLARAGDKSLLNQRIGRFCNWGGDVLPEYMFRLFQSSRFQRHAIEMCEGSKVKHIFWPYIARYVLRVPPLDEQQSVVNIIREVDALLAQEADRASLHRSIHQHLTAVALDCDSAVSLVEAKRE